MKQPAEPAAASVAVTADRWPTRQSRAALGFVVLALVALIAVPIWIDARIQAIRHEIRAVIEPATAHAARMTTHMDREVAAVRGYRLSGEIRFLDGFRAARAEQVDAILQLQPLAQQIGPVLEQLLADFQRAATAWQEAHRRFVEVEPGTQAVPGQMQTQEDLHQNVITAGEQLEAQLLLEREQRIAAIMREERRGLWMTSVLALLAFAAALVVAALSRRVRRLAREATLLYREAVEEHERADAAANQLRATQKIIDAELAHDTTDELLSALLSHTCDALACDSATVLLLDPDGETLSVRASYGSPTKGGDRYKVRVGEGLAGRIAAAGEALVVEDLASIDEAGPVVGEQITSVIGAPLLLGENVVGVVHFGTESRRRFSDEDARLIRLVADRSARAIERVRLFEAAIASNRSKSEFLATMSHELRTPLNAIFGYVQLLELGIPAPIPEAAREQVRRIDASARHLLGIIEEILTFSRVEADQEKIRKETINLPELIDAITPVVEPLARKKNLDYAVDLEGAPAAIVTDPARLKQILIILIGNAIKFTDQGSVEVSARQDHADAVIRVRDTGIGIRPEHRSRVFEPFWQADQSSTRVAGGTGLGLTVGRGLAWLLGGDITVSSTPGAGSTFEVRLPHSVVDRQG
jgi:signal transduction histidine kinase/CHASE3 domain sensor protein